MYSPLERFFITLNVHQLRYILSFMHIYDVLTLERVSLTLRNISRLYQGITFDFNRFFSLWFPDVKNFRQLLHDCNAVVSGSQALQFFSRATYLESDLDIFVRAGGFQPLSRYLLAVGYYPQFSRANLKPYEIKGLMAPSTLARKCLTKATSSRHPLLGVYNFKKTIVHQKQLSNENKTRELLVQIVVIDTEPIHHVIFGFHSSTFKVTMSQSLTAHVLRIHCSRRHELYYGDRRSFHIPSGNTGSQSVLYNG